MPELKACALWQIERDPLPGPCAVVRMADSADQLAVIKDEANVLARLDLIFNDAAEPFGGVRPPTPEDAQRILAFVRQHMQAPTIMFQCQFGVGRSQAAMAAVARIHGRDPRPILHRGTYNRRLYNMILDAAGIAPRPEPLVSMAVRVKYAADRLQLLILSMQRQRHANWELVAVTDGPNPSAAELVAGLGDPRIRLIETDRPLGKWGHPYRQLGLDACRGEFIGMSNDDNYYVPGYLEQMLNALEDADLALCQTLHSYAGWSVQSAADLGCWVARASLVRAIPWPGDRYNADAQYIQALQKSVGRRQKLIERPLFVHN